MVIGCKQVWERMHHFLDGTLDGELLAAVEQHLWHCGLCSVVLDSTRNLLSLRADGRVFQLPPGFSERLHARLDEELSKLEPCTGVT